MINLLFLNVILSFIADTNESSLIRYDGFKVLRVLTPNDVSANIIRRDLKDHVDIWSELRHHLDIMVSPNDMNVVENKLKDARLEYSVMIDHIQTLIYNEKTNGSRHSFSRRASNNGHPMSWVNYHSLSDMDAYMDYLNKKFPQLVSSEEIGTSYQGRQMRILKICKDNIDICDKKPGIFINGGIHAREWISPATVTFIMKELVENSSKYPSELLDKLNWYFLPVSNPDGYEYSRTASRMWRKNRFIFS